MFVAAPPTTLATRQLSLTMLGGAVLALPLALLAALGSTWHQPIYPGSDPYLLLLLKEWLGFYFGVVGTAILPALGAAGLRWPLMRRLFEQCLTLGPKRGRRVALLGTAGWFAATVLLAAGLGYALLYPTLSLGMCAWLCIAFSLPWGLAALGATWHVLRPAAPVVGPAAAS